VTEEWTMVDDGGAIEELMEHVIQKGYKFNVFDCSFALIQQQNNKLDFCARNHLARW